MPESSMPDSRLKTLVDLLCCEEPLALLHTAKVPDRAHLPKVSGHSCLLNFMRLARLRKTPFCFTAETTACMGGKVYLGFLLPPPERVAHFVTTGFQGGQGERYLPGPESMYRFFADLDMQPSSAPCWLVCPASTLADEEKPELFCFHARGEALSGLMMLTCFALDDHHGVLAPFGSGCANIFAWPLHYRRKGLKKAVLGGADPSCRPYLKTDEMTFTVTAEVLDAMLDAYPQSFLMGNMWSAVRKKAEKSEQIWKA